jgi:mannose-6-phosphate isomerase-like protein (cupin superfamily)
MSKMPVTIESFKNNGSKRSVTRAVFPAGAEAVFHYHTQYQETFRVLSGELKVIHGNIVQTVRQGQSSDIIPKNETHRYTNVSINSAEVDIILEPGHEGCEMTNSIITGLEQDDSLHLLSAFGGYNITWLVLYELTNTIPTGVPGVVFSLLKFLHGKQKIEKARRSLIEMYCNLAVVGVLVNGIW